MVTSPTVIEIGTFADSRGTLSVIENGIPLEFKRVFWVTNIHKTRGGHYHKDCTQLLIPILGAFAFTISKPDGLESKDFIIGHYSDTGLLVPPGHCITYTTVDHQGALLVLADRHFNDDVTIPCGEEK